MNSALIQAIFGAMVVAVPVIVIELIVERLRPTGRRGVPSITVGAALLVLGGLLSMAAPARNRLTRPTVLGTHSRLAVERIILFGGALFIAYGLIWRLASIKGRQQILRLSDRIREKAELVASGQEVINGIVRSSVSGVMILDAIRDTDGTLVDFRCRFMNKEAERLVDRRANELLGEPLLAHVPCLEDRDLFYEAGGVLEGNRPFRDERCARKDGREMWYQIAVVKHGDGIIATFTDVTLRKQTEKKLKHVAKHDVLTDLPGRPLMIDRLTQAITHGKQFTEYQFALLLLDFDRFKIVNDSLGPKVGDALLVSIAQRLRKELDEMEIPARPNAEHLPARLGGDEFVVLLDGIFDARGAMMVAERLHEILSQPHSIDGHEVACTASIGIVTSDGNYEHPEDVLRDADTAMCQAKSAGKARSVIFDERMHSEVLERLNLEKELRTATEQQAFVLHYQPIVSLETSALKGFEALIRWPHPQRGMVPPLAFIGIAEELGLIVPIGEWVLREAAGQLRRWQELRSGQALSMTVNLSKRQLAHPGLVAAVAETVEQAGIEPGLLVLEITEGTIMDNLDELTPVLSSLRDIGVLLAMDDFGTGHSSLSFLHRVPMDLLKIDRSFINLSGKGRRFDAIIETIVRLAHNLDMDVVAEGIETPDQMVLLQSLNCNYAQGYLFSKPLEASDAGTLALPDYRFTRAA